MATVRPFDLTHFERTTEEIYSGQEFEDKLASRKQLRIKYGVDATAPFLHIGHAVNLWMMRDLQDHGHKVVFLIGDFTTRIGDPTDKEQTRGKITDEEIIRNAELFIAQVSEILRTDEEVFEIRRNSEWYSCMDLGDFLNLLTMVTHTRLIQRDMFERRIVAGREIYMHELLYPVLQGYDSYALQSDLTIVGTDQLFNELMGRFYQEKLGQDPQVVLTTRITPGIDGREKQSKSLGNYIALSDAPRDKFGKAMRLRDDLVPEFAEVYSLIPLDELREMFGAVDRGELNPMVAKRAFARALVERYHGADAAREEDEWFQRVFSERKVPESMPEVGVAGGERLMAVLERCLPEESRSELRRLVQGGAVRLNDVKLLDPDVVIGGEQREAVLRIGRRRWFRLRPSPAPAER
ncbi:MAG: tyrosine--tRNA ligase [Nitriliruptorales bacterium]|nr:tyrosine--tRNA ligase [Nitriliruptorales bacterium]